MMEPVENALDQNVISRTTRTSWWCVAFEDSCSMEQDFST